ncbi:MAG TPA: TPM domain-containing protein [Luteimonas sp.]|nr:TPM domain-containing protein [Luteimonas sp.]
MPTPTRPALALASLALALGACTGGEPDGGGATATGEGRPAREWTDRARVDAIASTLQACSYEGGSIAVAPGDLRGKAPADCRAMVDRIMGYTGLPANFLVTAGPVPNALAVILLDDAKVPQRVIAFNPDFIDATRRLAAGDWAPVSIMAHEIGHHLSGHTITAGGSRPAIELEADKFSGYVLYKMGARLADATAAMDRIGSDVEQATHPAKARRVAAIGDGWTEACRQAGAGGCDAGIPATPSAGPPATPPATPANTPPIASTRPSTSPSTTPVQPVAPVAPGAPTARTTLPAPSPQSIPFKSGRFLADETGTLQPADATRIAAALQRVAREQGLEFAILVTDDLHGMDVQQYAWAMLRQLRIGQLDLGNGGVLVVSPGKGTAAAAYAPGIARMLEFTTYPEQLARSLAGPCEDPAACTRLRGSSIAMVADSLVQQLARAQTRFQVRFRDIASIIAAADANIAARRKARAAGTAYDDLPDDRMLGSLVRFNGTVTDLAPKPEQLRVNAGVVKDGRWQAVLVESEGREVTLYMQPQTPQLMPSGALETGREYTFTGELHSTGKFHTDTGVLQGNVQLRVFSYDAL